MYVEVNIKLVRSSFLWYFVFAFTDERCHIFPGCSNHIASLWPWWKAGSPRWSWTYPLACISNIPFQVMKLIWVRASLVCPVSFRQCGWKSISPQDGTPNGSPLQINFIVCRYSFLSEWTGTMEHNTHQVPSAGFEPTTLWFWPNAYDHWAICSTA